MSSNTNTCIRLMHNIMNFFSLSPPPSLSLSLSPSNSQRGDKNHFRSLLFNMEDVLSWRRKLLHSNVTHVRTKISLIIAVCPLAIGLFFKETSPSFYFSLILGFFAFLSIFSPGCGSGHADTPLLQDRLCQQ